MSHQHSAPTRRGLRIGIVVAIVVALFGSLAFLFSQTVEAPAPEQPAETTAPAPVDPFVALVDASVEAMLADGGRSETRFADGATSTAVFDPATGLLHEASFGNGWPEGFIKADPVPVEKFVEYTFLASGTYLFDPGVAGATSTADDGVDNGDGTWTQDMTDANAGIYTWTTSGGLLASVAWVPTPGFDSGIPAYTRTFTYGLTDADRALIGG